MTSTARTDHVMLTADHTPPTAALAPDRRRALRAVASAGIALLGAAGIGISGAAKPAAPRRRAQRRTKQRRHRARSASGGQTPSAQAFGLFPGGFIERKMVSKTVTVAKGMFNRANAACPAAAPGEVVVATGGGYESSQGVTVVENRPDNNDTSWRAGGFNTTTSEQSLTAFVICVRYQASFGTG